jgi:hypothetical protein
MKIINTYTATMAAALLLGGAPALASADEMATGPVQLGNVQSNQVYTPDFTSDPGFATVAFTNTGSMPATDVVFAVKSGGNVVDVYDAAGSFAPGVAISKNFPSTVPASDRDIEVESVTYSDGSVWVNPDADFGRAPASSAMPAASSAAPADNSSSMPSEAPASPSDNASAAPSDSSAVSPSGSAPGETAPGSSAPNPQY